MGLVKYRESGRRSWQTLLVQHEIKSVGKYRQKESCEKGLNELEVLQALTGLMLKTTSFFLDFCDFYKALHLAFHATFLWKSLYFAQRVIVIGTLVTFPMGEAIKPIMLATTLLLGCIDMAYGVWSLQTLLVKHETKRVAPSWIASKLRVPPRALVSDLKKRDKVIGDIRNKICFVDDNYIF